MMQTKTELVESDYINSLILFGASWCQPCKKLKPVIEEISSDYENVNFIYVDADSSIELVQEHKILSVPTVKLFVNGEEKRSFLGLLPKTDYTGVLDLYFGDG